MGNCSSRALEVTQGVGSTDILAEHRTTICVAAGNSEPANNTLNPWSVAPWVIGGGAAYPDGKRLWEKSSRGIAKDVCYRPTVVAPGVEIPTIRTGHANEVTDATSKYAIVTGSSFAIATVTGIASLCIDWIDGLAACPEIAEW